LLASAAFAHNGVVDFPVSYMRGGTSTGVVLWEPHLAPFGELRDEIIRKIMGVPESGELKGNKQITGLGRGPSTSNKVMIVERGDGVDADFNSTLAQLAAEKSSIDWSVNCGNMSAAIPLFLLNNRLISTADPVTLIRIYNTNTGIITDCRMHTPGTACCAPDLAEIPGVPGMFPRVELSLRQPAGSKTALLLPTGSVRDVFDGVEVSCVDAAVPMVIISARSLNLRGDESLGSLNADLPLKSRLRSIWVQAGLAMRLKNDGALMTADELAQSETVPKVCIVSAPKHGGNISVWYFTPQELHASLAVTGGCCLATACLIPGTTAHEMASGILPLSENNEDRLVCMENPVGMLRATVHGSHVSPGHFVIPWVAYERNAQLFMEGCFRIYQPSSALLQRAMDLSSIS
jgi:2-methylaconitate cis-trans-isomerase PrpF